MELVGSRWMKLATEIGVEIMSGKLQDDDIDEADGEMLTLTHTRRERGSHQIFIWRGLSQSHWHKKQGGCSPPPPIFSEKWAQSHLNL